MARTRRLPTHRRPTHPGFVLEENIRKPRGLTQQAFADALGITRVRYAQIAAGKRSVTPDTALRLARVLGTSAEMWLSMQQGVDLWDAARAEGAEVIAKLEELPALEAIA